jgi:O-methyltransferase involved in polyketide biosynthesis
MNSSEISDLNLEAVSETLFIPLQIRAIESQRPDALIQDEVSAALVERLGNDFPHITLKEHQRFGFILRLREFDRMGRDFLARHPQAVVVHIGCGLDTRFERLDNGQVEWYDLDLPAVIILRQNLLPNPCERYHHLACSVFDEDWIEVVNAFRQRPFLFIAEGVLPYFEEVQVRSLVLRIKEHFPGAELVCDAHRPFMVWLNNLNITFTKFKVRLRWKLKYGRDLESWGEGIRLLEEYFFFDQSEPRLGAVKWMRYIPPLAKGTGIFRYRLGELETALDE